MRKGILAAFVAALSIFAATVPSYARVWECAIEYGFNEIDTIGWHHDGTGWKLQSSDGDSTGWVWSNGRLYHIDEKTGYCDLDTTVTDTYNHRTGYFTVDKTGALTENGVVVDLGRKDNEFTFLTYEFNWDYDQKSRFNKNAAQETEKKALKYGLKPTGEKIYANAMSDYNYCGWVVTAPGFDADYNCRVTFYDETANRDTTMGKMKEHPDHTYSLRLFVAFADAVSILDSVRGIISPTSYLVPAGYLPTP